MFTLKRLWLDQDPSAHKAWAKLMEETDLSPSEEVEYTVGIYAGEQLVATGSYDRNIVKCLAVSPDHQSENLLTQVMVHLMEKMQEAGQLHYFVYTKPANEMVFRSLGFQKIAATDQILFMEQGTPNFADYEHLLRKNKKTGNASAIVMNANPFTKGHQYLVESAAEKSDQVYVFVLSEERSEFSSKDRLAMVKAGVAHLSGVTVLPTNDYMVSSATFPSYFLKDAAQAGIARAQATLDAELFKDRVAPILEIKTRFVGEEPYSEVTEIYNQSMRAVFGESLALVILPRLAVGGEIVSATKVRKALKDGDNERLKAFLPQTTYDYLQKIKKINDRGEESGNY